PARIRPDRRGSGRDFPGPRRLWRRRPAAHREVPPPGRDAAQRDGEDESGARARDRGAREAPRRARSALTPGTARLQPGSASFLATQRRKEEPGWSLAVPGELLAEQRLQDRKIGRGRAGLVAASLERIGEQLLRLVEFLGARVQHREAQRRRPVA